MVLLSILAAEGEGEEEAERRKGEKSGRQSFSSIPPSSLSYPIYIVSVALQRF